MKLGLMFFAGDALQDEPYRLMMRVAPLADRAGFSALWTPERHFHRFGGAFASPALTSAALAVLTKRIDIRAGSVVSPLHNFVRIAEEWAMVDRLSAGRVAVSFASGWHPNDFFMAPAAYPARFELMQRQIEAIRALWRGGSVRGVNGCGEPVEVTLFPRPLQRELPIWVSASKSQRTFEWAGEIGANVLTHLVAQSPAVLVSKIAAYREARTRCGHAGPGIVTLMLHSYVAETNPEARNAAREPMMAYLRAWLSLESQGGRTSPRSAALASLGADALDELVETSCETYFNERSLIGTLESCRQRLRTFVATGVDEIACLIDFGIEDSLVVASIERLAGLIPQPEVQALAIA